jgi:hypothetical protein
MHTASQTIWWHTVLHVILAMFLFIPSFFAISFLFGLLIDVFSGGLGGLSHAFVLEVCVYAIATGLSLSLPTLVLKESNKTFAAVVLSVIISFVIVLMVSYALNLKPISRFTGEYWMEVIAALLGVVSGMIGFVKTSSR